MAVSQTNVANSPFDHGVRGHPPGKTLAPPPQGPWGPVGRAALVASPHRNIAEHNMDKRLAKHFAFFCGMHHVFFGVAH